ncbi:MAG: BNR-4 repeat-containing protein, partial [Planctomycetota bacterium]
PLRYGTSRPGFLADPPVTMTAADFEPPRPLIPGSRLESRATYPRFLSNPPAPLHFIYRQGGSGSGDTYLQRYDAATHTWRRLGATGLFSRRGTYPAWGNSTSRNAYLNDVLLDPDGRLHATWCYRETSRTWASNHDLHYAYTDDGGGTWRNNAGERIADLPQRDSIELADPGIVVRPIPVFSWLMNQTAMALDADNQPHVVTFHLAEPERPKGRLAHNPPPEIGAKLRLFHYWRTKDGQWHGSGPVTPLATRPGIIFDRSGDLIVYYAKAGRVRVHMALRADDWQRWEHADIAVPDVRLLRVSKPDLGRMRRDGVLSMAGITSEEGGRRGFVLLDFALAAPRE